MQMTIEKVKIIKAVITTLIVVLLINAVFESIIFKKQGEFYVQHEIIVKAIRDYVASHDSEPNNLKDLSLSQFSDSIKYYPQAWSKAGQILLQSQFLNFFYFVTFGDESTAILRSYRIHERDSSGEVITKNALKSNYDLKTRYLLDCYPLLSLLFLVFALIATWFIENYINKKRRQEKE
jgi:hypothetical protein